MYPMLNKKIRIINKKLFKEMHKKLKWCQLCGISEAGLEIHHIRSRGAGGDDIKSNLVMLCKKCHKRAWAFKKQLLKIAIKT